MSKKLMLAMAAVTGLVYALPSYAAFSTTTITSILDDTLTDAGSILEVNLPTIFVFLLTVTAIFMLFRWVRGILRRPR